MLFFRSLWSWYRDPLAGAFYMTGRQGEQLRLTKQRYADTKWHITYQLQRDGVYDTAYWCSGPFAFANAYGETRCPTLISGSENPSESGRPPSDRVNAPLRVRTGTQS